MNGKSDKRRPTAISKEEEARNWDNLDWNNYPKAEPIPDTNLLKSRDGKLILRNK